MITSKVDSDGIYWWKPDAYVGSEKYYSVDWSEWLDTDNDTINGEVEWGIPTGLTEQDTKLSLGIASVKLRADTVGEYEISCKVPTIEGADTQLPIFKAKLKVVA